MPHPQDSEWLDGPGLDAVLGRAFPKAGKPDAAAPIPPASTTALGPRYSVDEELARGGMGIVLRGHDEDLGRDIAIKVLRADYADDAAMRARFFREAKIGGRLQHPGIVPVYDVGLRADQRPFLTMKLVGGRTLADLVRDAGKPRDRLLSIFEQVCQTVGYAHAAGVVHRDLKPHNVMVGEFGEVVVVDWGLAKSIDPEVPPPAAEPLPAPGESSPGSVLGTPGYMAPEQARGEQADARSDVFALGSMLCEILTGEPAFPGSDPAEVRARTARGDLAECHRLLDGCTADPELVALCRSCLQQTRDRRPATAREVAEAVAAHRNAVAERAQAERLARAAAESRVHAERRLRRFTVLGTALLVTVVGIAAAVWQVTDLRRQRLEAAQRETMMDAFDEARDAIEAAALSADVDAWEAAVAAVERVHASYGRGALSDLETRVDELSVRARAGYRAAVDATRIQRENRALAAAFDEIVFDDNARVADEAFREYIGDPSRTPPSILADRLAARGFGPDFAEWIDHWALRVEGPLAGHLLALSDYMDADATRSRIRAAWDDHDVLAEIARGLEPEDHSSHTIHLLVRDQIGRRGALWVASEFGDLGIVHGLLQRALAAHPDAVGLHWEAARFRLHEQAIAAGAADLQAALSHAIAVHGLRPDLEFGWKLRAEVLLRMDRSREAVLWARRFADARPTDASAKRLLATALTRDGQHEEAASLIHEALDSVPHDPDVWATLGEIEENLGNTWPSLAARAKAAEHATRSGHLLPYALQLERTGDRRSAIAWLERAVQGGGGDLACNFELGRAYGETGKQEKMRAQAQRVFDIGVHYVEHHHSLASAAQAYRMALELDPAVAGHLAVPEAILVHAALGRVAELMEGCRAHCISTDDPAAWFAFAECLAYAGRRQEAVEAYDRALRADSPPYFHFAYYGFALINAGQLEPAQVAYEKAIAVRGESGFMEDAKRQLARMIELRDGAASNGTMRDHLALGSVCRVTGRYADAVRSYRAAFLTQPDKTPKIYIGRAAYSAIAAAQHATNDHDREAFLRQALIWTHQTLESARAKFSISDGRLMFLSQFLPLVVSSRFAPVRDEPRTLIMSPELDSEWDELWAEVHQYLQEVARQ